MSEKRIWRFALLMVRATIFLLLPLAGCQPLHGLGHGGGHNGYGSHGNYGGDGGGHGGHP